MVATPGAAPAARRSAAQQLPSTGSLADRFHRPLRDLRISLTDRCNFRCVYCMPRAVFGRDYAFLDHEELLTFDEIERIARISAAHGVRKLRPHGRRAAAAPRRRRADRAACRTAHARRRPPRDRADDERRGPRREGAGAEGCRARSPDRVDRFARR
jgi:cyclic pyranopterin phosphate synthase